MNQIHFRLNEKEAAIIEQKAAAAEMKPNTYCKNIALNAKIKPPILDKEAAKMLLPQIAKVGANVNQIARSLNMGAEVPKEAVEDTKTQLQELLEAIWAAVLDGKTAKKEKKEEPVEPDAGDHDEQKNDDAACSTIEHNETQCNETEHNDTQEEAHICKNCGAPCEKKYSVKHERYYWSCTKNGIKCPFNGWAD